MARSLFRLALALGVLAGGAAYAADPALVPAQKRTPAGLYLTAVEAAAMKRELGPRVLFVDVRSRAEAMFVGMATSVDALVPFAEWPAEGATWDESHGAWKLAVNPRFIADLDARAAERGLDRGAPVIFMCLGGDRSARATAAAYAAGYLRPYTVIDGFEGDLSPAGRRDVNGWKNAGLPWSYRLEAAKVLAR